MWEPARPSSWPLRHPPWQLSPDSFSIYSPYHCNRFDDPLDGPLFFRPDISSQLFDKNETNPNNVSHIDPSMARCTLWELQHFREPGMGPIDRIPADQLDAETLRKGQQTWDACPFKEDSLDMDPHFRFMFYKPKDEKLRQRWVAPPDPTRPARLMEQHKSHFIIARTKLLRQLAETASFSGHHHLNLRGEMEVEQATMHGQVPCWEQRREIDMKMRVLDHRLSTGAISLPPVPNHTLPEPLNASVLLPPPGQQTQPRPWALDRFGHALAAPCTEDGECVLSALTSSDFSTDRPPWAAEEAGLKEEEREARRRERRRRKRVWSIRMERIKMILWRVQEAQARRAERKIMAQVKRRAQEVGLRVRTEPRGR